MQAVTEGPATPTLVKPAAYDPLHPSLRLSRMSTSCPLCAPPIPPRWPPSSPMRRPARFALCRSPGLPPKPPSGARLRPRTASIFRSFPGCCSTEPEELVISALAGTPIEDIAALLAENAQELPVRAAILCRPLWHRVRHAGRVPHDQLFRPAPDQGRCGSGFCFGDKSGVRPWRGFQGGRPGRQECHGI